MMSCLPTPILPCEWLPTDRLALFALVLAARAIFAPGTVLERDSFGCECMLTLAPPSPPPPPLFTGRTSRRTLCPSLETAFACFGEFFLSLKARIKIISGSEGRRAAFPKF